VVEPLQTLCRKFSLLPSAVPRRATRLWFNKTFSSLEHPLSTLRDAWRLSGGLHVQISHTDNSCGSFVHADHTFTEPRDISEIEYVEWCLHQCRRHRVDVFIPGRRMAQIAACLTDFANVGTRVLLAAKPESLITINDKILSHKALQGLLPLPESHLVSSMTDFRAAVSTVESFGHRACFKPVSGAGGVGFYLLDERATPQRRLMEGWAGGITAAEAEYILAPLVPFPQLVVMEHLPGEEYSVDTLAWHGEVRMALARCKRGSMQTVDCHPVLERHMRTLAAHFGLSGLFNAQFRTDKQGVLRFLEVNPRMSGGLGNTEAAGVHLLALALELCLNDGVETMPLPLPRLPVTVLACRRAIEVPQCVLAPIAETVTPSKHESFV
jgi:glutathione synthase/RimK-type ligase-like ATP-grasp enzyme